MYTTADAVGEDHYEDFFDTCSFLFDDPARVDRLRGQFSALRLALTSTGSIATAEGICRDIGEELSCVMARTERLAATPNRDGMLHESETLVEVKPVDLRAYRRLGNLAEAVKHHEPTEYWKSAPYLVNFMEAYKLKAAVVQSAADGRLPGGMLDPDPGLLNWRDVDAYECVDPQNGRLRWLLGDLEHHRAFELLWIPPSMRYYDAGSVYETPEAASFTKRLVFSGWAVVPKVVSSLVSFESERRAFAGRDLKYTASYRRRGGQRLAFRRDKRTAGQARRGESTGARRAAGMTTFLLIWPSPSLAGLGDPRPLALSPGRAVSEVLNDVAVRIADAIEPLVRGAPTGGVADQRWYWAAPLLLDQRDHPSVTDRLLAQSDLVHWEGDESESGLRAHVVEARTLLDCGVEALGRPPDDLSDVLAQLAIGGPAQCALRAIGSVAELPIAGEAAVLSAARVGAAFRRFFNGPEVTGIIDGGRSVEPDVEEGGGRYWRDVLRHAIDGNLQAVLDEHTHVVRDWRGHLRLPDDDRRAKAADDIAQCIVEALELRTSWFRVDTPRRDKGDRYNLAARRMRTRFAVPFGNQALDGGGEARVESVSRAFNSPFWPFVLTSTSIGQEGLDFHLWCHAVVHWNLPSNPVDLEQREGRVHRYKGHAVRRNIAAALAPDLFAGALVANADPWRQLFAMAVPARPEADDEMVPYWVFDGGPAKIERLVPILPFSQDAAAVPRLRKSLAAYRLAFGQPRQEELIEFLGADRSDEDLLQLASRLHIELSPPSSERMHD